MDFRPAAVPLMTVDPYFSIWSAADRLGDDCPRHWTGRPASIYLAVELDGKRYPICAFDRNHVKRAQGVERMVQTGLRMLMQSDFGVDWGSFMAAATLITMPMILFFVCLQRYFVQGITKVGLK